MRVELRTVVGPFLRSSHSLHLLRKPAVVCIRGGRASESVSRSLALTRIRALSSASVRPSSLTQLQSWQSQRELTSFLQLSAHFISNSNLQRRERAGETGRPRGRRGRAGMFNVNFYGTTAWQREGKRGRGTERGRERESEFGNKERVHYKSSGTLPFYGRGRGSRCMSAAPLHRARARTRRPPSRLSLDRSLARSVALWFIIPLSRFNLRTLSQQCRRRRRESQHNRLLSLSSLGSASLPGK